MFQRFTPINNCVLVQLQEKETTTQSGIIIPSQLQENNQEAIVLHPGKSKQVKIDDIVYYKKNTGTMLNDTLMVLKEEDILGVL